VHDFAKVSKNLAKYTSEILMNYQNDYVGRSNWLLEYQNFL